jgi:hypothetical protein
MNHNMLRHHYIFSRLMKVRFVQPCFPPTHEVEEAISLNDEEIEDPVEAILASVLPHTKTKRWLFLVILMVL